MTEIDPKTKQQKQRPIKPIESVWYKYEQLFTDNYKNIEDDSYKKELLSFNKKMISGDENSTYRRVWTKPITTYAANYNHFDISVAPLKEHIFNRVKWLTPVKTINSGLNI